MSVDVKILKLAEDVKLPVYKHDSDAGADVCAHISSPIILKRGEFKIIPTGIKYEMSEGYEIQVRPRSGLAAKNGVTVLNTPGTLDSSFRGEVGVILINLGNEEFVINNGDRIAQLVLSPVTHANYIEASEVSETERGEGGFGSTGVK